MRKGADREMEALSGSGPVEVRGHREEESLLILINHCREMKQQEARLRLITLLLLLGCAAAFIFISCADLSQRRAAVRAAAGRGRPEAAETSRLVLLTLLEVLTGTGSVRLLKPPEPAQFIRTASGVPGEFGLLRTGLDRTEPNFLQSQTDNGNDNK